ncbi:hypothetical protein ABZ128_09505 [Streptomyces sp. NPDC006326]|uniref:hypothetical protein n=1 Tax=Streptomyces sp. NPDC006326 TaxID=3156752 RepID=UPI0033B8EC4C
MKRSSTIHTADGSTVTVRPHGNHAYDLETRNPKGETIATVVMSAADLQALVNQAEVILPW